MNQTAIIRVLLAIIFLLLITVGTINYYLNSQNNNPKNEEEVALDETTDWETYVNEELGIEFKYPPAPIGCESQCKENKGNNTFTIGRTEFSIKNSEGLSLPLFVDGCIKDFNVSSKENKIIGGKEGIIVNYRFGGMDRFGEAAFVENDNKVYIFNFTAGAFCCTQGDTIYESDVFNAMVSTFKFLD